MSKHAGHYAVEKFTPRILMGTLLLCLTTTFASMLIGATYPQTSFGTAQLLSRQSDNVDGSKAPAMETGFFESLELTPDVIIRRSEKPVLTPETRREPSTRKTTGSGAPVDVKVDSVTVREKTHESTLSFDNIHSLFTQEELGMWQYLILALNAFVFLLVLLILVRMYRNTRIVESPDNIIAHIKNMGSEFEAQNKTIREIKFRIQKTENTFIKVLGHHIDDKYNQIQRNLDMQFQDFTGGQKSALKQFGEIAGRVNDIESLLQTLKEFVAEQRQEVRRIHEGYDWSAINSICIGLIGAIDNIDEIIAKAKTADNNAGLLELRETLVVLLDTHNVKEVAPKVGSDYDSKASQGAVIKTITPTEPRLRGKIAQVIKPSFVYADSNEQQRVIREAELVVYN